MVIFTGITFLHSLAFLVYWLASPLFYGSVNDFLVKAVKVQVDFVFIFLGLSTALGLWSLARIWRGWMGKLVGGKKYYVIIAMVYLVFFYGSFVVLFLQDSIQLNRLGQMIGYFRVILDTLLLVGLAWLLRPFILKAKFAWLAAVMVLAIIWFGAFFAPPGNVMQGKLAEKPRLTAHRGASMLAPENTLVAAQKAFGLGAFTLEVDIRISQDGIPFLMHDATLARTTDVVQVFLGREKNRAETFTFDELRRLSAGNWFVSKDPFGTIKTGLVTGQESVRFTKEPVPSLAEILKELKTNNLNLIFDIETAPTDHTYANAFFELVLKQIKEAGIDSRIWFLADEVKIPLVKASAPGMKLAAGINGARPPAAVELVKKGYQLVNSEYRLPESALHDYQQAGLWVNIWTVDETWQFSRLWLLGVDSITTNNSHSFATLNTPIFAISLQAYGLVWGGFGLISLLILLLQKKPVIK